MKNSKVRELSLSLERERAKEREILKHKIATKQNLTKTVLHGNETLRRLDKRKRMKQEWDKEH